MFGHQKRDVPPLESLQGVAREAEDTDTPQITALRGRVARHLANFDRYAIGVGVSLATGMGLECANQSTLAVAAGLVLGVCIAGSKIEHNGAIAASQEFWALTDPAAVQPPIIPPEVQ